MKFRTFGPTGRDVPMIGQGTWNMEVANTRTAVKAIQRGIEHGLTHIDTAEMYGNGRVEELVAKAIRGRRENVFLVSKVLPSHASRKNTLLACHRSLTRLKTDYLDCYLLHWLGSYPLADTIEAFEELVTTGAIRMWGVSNFGEDDLAEAVTLAGERRVACNQVLYHLEERTIEHAIIPFCEQHDIAVVGYSPFGSGRFPTLKGKGGKVLCEVAEAHGVSPRQVALRFLTRRASLFTIPKSAQIEHVQENAKASDLQLSKDELQRIEKAFPLGPRRRGIPTL